MSKYLLESKKLEGCLHCSKDQLINGNGSNGIHEEGSPSEVQTDELNDEFRQDQELLSENG